LLKKEDKYAEAFLDIREVKRGYSIMSELGIKCSVIEV